MTNATTGATTKAAAVQPPKTLWEKVLAYTPVVMTVIATLLAGLSNSELSSAQYDRAAGAQWQSKAADQWNFFQVKKIRGLSMDNTIDVLDSTAGGGEFRANWEEPRLLALMPRESAAIREVLNGTITAKPDASQKDVFESERGVLRGNAEVFGNACNGLAFEIRQAAAVELLGQAMNPPEFQPQAIRDSKVAAAAAAIAEGKADSEINPLVRAVKPQALEEEFKTFTMRSAALDAAMGPIGKKLDEVRPHLEQMCLAANSCERSAKALAGVPSGEEGEAARMARALSDLSAVAAESREMSAGFSKLRLKFGSRRYAMEAPLNQQLALLTEIRVHQSNISAEDHRTRSQLFFVGVLIAQAAVIGATLALAVKQKSVLWSLAAVAGLAAISFGVYVRFFV